ncbi:MAG TPA: arginine--tRNA ligase [Bacteroidales bacterium]|jgi:arginyl-tRNA synthetase|nr:arginine--tRNA ligase [Bacteroidales bacterium]MCZ2418144.1 arginine--tRNA ligase [Burkholderiales bacterium]OQC56602.1 MAG: Arginine--tRNA ligase [Bacteroidetes bacterium ADurb.Bin013]MBP8999977.1 arginine--tRNA ligase [Bacteroidales bacterium]MBV6456374.1 Arginine--tRNA ligase [Bacteroidales bacterium]
MNAEDRIIKALENTVIKLYGITPKQSIQLQETRKEFEGDFTFVVYPLLPVSRKSPEQTATELGQAIIEAVQEVESFQVIKGFLNLKMSPYYWMSRLQDIADTPAYGTKPHSGKTVMVEFSSPNTNKPLHLGHIRNNLLGWSVSRIMEANGHRVIKVNLVNDRGIHICKSMLAWQKSGLNTTPESSGQKGDHLVGDFYILFEKQYKEQVQEMVNSGVDREQALKEAPLMQEAQSMLVKWEQGDGEVVGLWKKMNGWVYDGFEQTYSRMGISFDKTYYESDTYLLGKELVVKGLEEGVFYRNPDNSVWCDLTQEGLDRKLLLRADGTSVYMTQDLGTAVSRYKEYGFDSHIYVVGNEQNYHFQVLKLILKKLGFSWADDIIHLSYGMVELPEGKMKSREGTVVDADDLIDNMVETAREMSLESGKLEDMTPQDREQLFNMLGMGALKYFILKVDPRKTMLFDPRESIDFNGNTGPFIQYTFARIRSILRKAGEHNYRSRLFNRPMIEKELRLIKLMTTYPLVVEESGLNYAPSLIANFGFDLAREFNQYYHEISVLHEPDEQLRSQRLFLLEQVARLLESSMELLGIILPERM